MGVKRQSPPLGQLGKDLARIHDVMGIKGLLDPPLQGHGRRGQLHPQIGGLGETDAVLPRQGAVKFPHYGKNILHRRVHRLPFPGDLAIVEHVDVDIAVPGMAVAGNDEPPAAGNFL